MPDLERSSSAQTAQNLGLPGVRYRERLHCRDSAGIEIEMIEDVRTGSMEAARLSGEYTRPSEKDKGDSLGRPYRRFSHGWGWDPYLIGKSQYA